MGITYVMGIFIIWFSGEILHALMGESSFSAAWFFTKKSGEIIFGMVPYGYPRIFSTITRIQDLTSKEEGIQSQSSFIPIESDDTVSFFCQKHLTWKAWAFWVLEAQNTGVFFYTMEKILHPYPYPNLVIDKDGTILFANDAFVHWLGYSARTLVGKNIRSFFYSEPNVFALSPEEDHILKNNRGEDVVSKIFYISLLPENSLWILSFLPSTFYQNIHSWTSDPLVQNLPLPLLILDEQGNIEHYNEVFYKNFSPQKNLPIPLISWVSTEDCSSFGKDLKRIRKNPLEHLSSSIHVRLLGGEHVSAFVQYIAPSQHTRGQFCVIFSPTIFNTKDKEEPKMHLLGQLTSGIIHDFNNMLTVIMGFCDLLIKKHSPQESSFKDIVQIKESSVRAMKLIQNLLSFSKSSLPALSVIDVTQCIHDLTPLITRMIGPKILLTVQQKENIPPIYVDKNQLEQLFLNLAINARDAITEKNKNMGGTLTFHIHTLHAKSKIPVIKGTLPPKNYVVVTIEDNGQGIPQEYLPHVFDAFFSTKAPGKGTGLGLSNTYQLMQQFHGGITLKTEIGEGTSISLFFPQHKGAVTSEQTAYMETHEDAHDMKTAILLVEDEDPIRLFASRALREHGHDVIEARDGPQALRFLKNNASIRVVVTDVMMPGMDGPTLAAEIHKNNPTVRVLFVSGYPEEEIRAQLPNILHDAHFLQKPFALKELIVAIEKFFP